MNNLQLVSKKKQILESNIINQVNRNSIVFLTARTISTFGCKYLTHCLVEFPDELKQLKNNKKSVYVYMGLHKSLWETSGVPSCLYLNKLPIPFVGMGDNLVKGEFFQSLAEKCGAFLIKRAGNRREVLQSAKAFKTKVKTFISNGIDILIFPEGTRKSIPKKRQYGDFFPTAFEGVIEYEKEKKANIELDSDYNAYIIPFNVDYSRVREDFEITSSHKQKPQTLHILDTIKWLARIGKTYISFGKPIPISEHLDKNRKQLAVYTRQLCLDLVKIMPINIVSRSICEMFQNNDQNYDQALLYQYIDQNIIKAAKYQTKFRNFTIYDQPQKLVRLVSKHFKAFRKIDKSHLALYQLYSDYVQHYFD